MIDERSNIRDFVYEMKASAKMNDGMQNFTKFQIEK